MVRKPMPPAGPIPFGNSFPGSAERTPLAGFADRRGIATSADGNVHCTWIPPCTKAGCIGPDGRLQARRFLESGRGFRQERISLLRNGLSDECRHTTPIVERFAENQLRVRISTELGIGGAVRESRRAALESNAGQSREDKEETEETMKPRVLIADADGEWLSICERGLCESGFAVETVRDGLACLARLERGPDPDVLVLELEMPWGGGDGVLASLRETANTPGQRVVVITGRAPADVLSERTGIPNSHCLRKPFHLDALLNLVSRAGMACVG
jgi:CheY-like chemotaxis protein